jgi:hypothetical protein
VQSGATISGYSYGERVVTGRNKERKKESKKKEGKKE